MAGHTPTVLNNLGYHYVEGRVCFRAQTLEAARDRSRKPEHRRNLDAANLESGGGEEEAPRLRRANMLARR
jgi:hypothetical protein